MSKLYRIEEYPDTSEGKFGGYKVTPIIDTSNPSPFVLAKLNVPIKYDANKDLDKQVSNNGINAI